MQIDASARRRAGNRGAAVACAIAALALAGTALAQGVQRPGPGPAGQGPAPGVRGPSAGPAPDIIDAHDANIILAELQSLGYNATLTRDSQGDPKIEGKMSKSPYHLYFYGCTNNDDCKYLQFVAGWDLTNGITLEKINDWNRDKLWGQAYRDSEDDPWISIVYNLDGGVTKANFADTVDWFRVTLEGFEEHIGWN